MRPSSVGPQPLKSVIVTAAGDDMEQASAELIKAANDHGGEDNITVVTMLFTP